MATSSRTGAADRGRLVRRGRGRAGGRDADGLAAASASLGRLDVAQVGLILGTVLRVALEDLHPDGLDGDDVREVLTSATRASAAWQADVDPQVFLMLLAGALGVHDPDPEATPPKPEVLARHAALLLAHVLFGQRPFDAYLERAAVEIERTQLND